MFLARIWPSNFHDGIARLIIPSLDFRSQLPNRELRDLQANFTFTKCVATFVNRDVYGTVNPMVTVRKILVEKTR